MITNVCITFAGLVNKIVFPQKTLNFKRIKIYDKDGDFVRFTTDSLLGCWIRLNGKYELNVRRVENFTRGECFAIKNAGENHYDIYIPKEAVNLTFNGEVVRNYGDYDYTYKSWSIDGNNVRTYGEMPNIVNEEKSNRIKFIVYDHHTATEEFSKVIRLAEEFEKVCQVRVPTYQLKEIVKHFNITKKRKKDIG